jgi:hypothetical protein
MNEQKKSIWNTIGDIARGVADGMNKNQQRPRPGIRAPKPRKPCGGCGGK